VLRHRARILKIDVLWGNLHIIQMFCRTFTLLCAVERYVESLL
jgi:hypothetical protein